MTTLEIPVAKTNNDTFYRDVALWLVACFGVAAGGTYLIGPLIPPTMMMPLYLVMLVAMLLSAFVRKSYKGSGVMAILYSLGLGVILYPTLNFYVSNGSGNIVIASLVGTAIVFGGAAILAWRSPKSMESWAGKLFVILLGVIALSLLNSFVFKMEFLQNIIAIGVLVIFSIYSFIDVQRVRDRSYGAPPSWYALAIFLDIYNIFVSLLQLFGASSSRN